MVTDADHESKLRRRYIVVYHGHIHNCFTVRFQSDRWIVKQIIV